jgi:hypothetical protein
MLTLLWMIPLIAAATGEPAPPTAESPLAPESATRATNGTKVAVELQVLAVGTYSGKAVALDYRATRDDKQNQFVVVLSEKAQAQLKRVGVHDLDRHFRGKRVRVVGPVTREIFTGLNQTGDYFCLHVDDISQFQQVD